MSTIRPKDSSRREIRIAVSAQIMVDLLEAFFRTVWSAGPYYYSVSVFGIPARYLMYGAVVSCILCFGVLNPIVLHYSYVTTQGFNRTAQNQYLFRYWCMMTILFLAIAAVGGAFSYLFRSELVFQ